MAKAKNLRSANNRPLKTRDNDLLKKVLAWIGIVTISLFIIFLMVGSMFEPALYGNDPQNRMIYGDYEFVYRDLGDGAGVLVADFAGQEVEFQNLPTQVGYLNVSPLAIDLLKNAHTVVLSSEMNINTSDSKAVSDASMIDYARLQLGLALGNTANAMLTPSEDYKLPVIDCSRATAQMVVVEFSTSNETRVDVDGYCIKVNAEQRDLMRVKDRIIFEYHGILDNGTVVED